MGKRSAHETLFSEWAVSQVTKKIRVSFEASRAQRQLELAEDLQAAVNDDEEFEILGAEPSPDRKKSTAFKIVDDAEDVMNDGGVGKTSTTQSKTSKRKNGRKPTWRIRISKLIGTYDSFLDVPEDFFDPDSWNARPRPDGYRSLLVRNRRENICIVGKGGLELWNLRSKIHDIDRWHILECIPENTILEGFWNEDLHHFYVFDLLVWNSMDMISCDFQARHFLLKSKWEEFILKLCDRRASQDIPSIRFLMVLPISLTVTGLRTLYDHVARCNQMTPMAPYTQRCLSEIDGVFGMMSPYTLDYPYTKYDGIVFTHNNSIYTPAINPFTLHWRHPNLSIWINETKKRYPKGSLIYSTLSQNFRTCDDTECRLLDCVLPADFTSETGRHRNLIVRIAYSRIDLVNKPSGETMIEIQGACIEKWKLDSETRKSWRWNGADSFSRLILDMPLYDQNGEKVDTASPDIEEVLRRARVYHTEINVDDDAA